MATRKYMMSAQEINRLEIIQRVLARSLSQVMAAQLMRLSTRQVRNLTRRYQIQGPSGLISQRRGKRSNNHLSPELKGQVASLIKAHYWDFGPTFAHEKITTKHGIKLSIESTRKIMIHSGLWKGKQRKKAQAHPRRARRPQRGELVQIDGSTHAWFEDRGPKCCLLVFADDATSEVLQGRFVATECLSGYFAALKGYLATHGRPVSLYSDRHGIFRINQPEPTGGSGETQFGRAVRELGIGLIFAHSPQAKGRVERIHGTLQDRLVKELRLQGISDIAAANDFLSTFLSQYNDQFAKPPASPVDAHRPALPEQRVLSLIFSSQYDRKVSKNLEVSYRRRIYQIQHKGKGHRLQGATVRVCDLGTEQVIMHNGRELECKVFTQETRPSKAVIKQTAKPVKKVTSKPAPNHPWRQYRPIQRTPEGARVKI